MSYQSRKVVKSLIMTSTWMIETDARLTRKTTIIWCRS